MAGLPLDVLNNLDLILARDTIYLTHKQLDDYDKLLTGHVQFLEAFHDFLLMFTRDIKVGTTSYLLKNLIPKHSGQPILIRCHDGSLIKLEGT